MNYQNDPTKRSFLTLKTMHFIKTRYAIISLLALALLLPISCARSDRDQMNDSDRINSLNSPNISAQNPEADEQKDIGSPLIKTPSETSTNRIAKSILSSNNKDSKTEETQTPKNPIPNNISKSVPQILPSAKVVNPISPTTTANTTIINPPKPTPNRTFTPTPISTTQHNNSGKSVLSHTPTQIPIPVSGQENNSSTPTNPQTQKNQINIIKNHFTGYDYPPTYTPTPTPTTTPTPTYTPTPTSTPTPTPTPTSTPTPTQTPVISPTPTEMNNRFAVVVHNASKDHVEHLLNELGITWYLNFDSQMDEVPNGFHKVPFIQIPADESVWSSINNSTFTNSSELQISNLGFFTATELKQMSIETPGSHWYVFGEPNRYSYITPEKYMYYFHYMVEALKDGDPSAKIVGPSMLNWDFTCIGCGGASLCEGVGVVYGYRCGKNWFEDFVDIYKNVHGIFPPIDIFATDIYPLDWLNSPNNESHASIAIEQVKSIRGYLNDSGHYKDTPIWITELGVHLGYDSYSFDGTQIVPVGNFRWTSLSAFQDVITQWLVENANTYNVQKWFLYVTYLSHYNEGGYMGIRLFDGPGTNSELNCLGVQYREASKGNTPIYCAANGSITYSKPY